MDPLIIRTPLGTIAIAQQRIDLVRLVDVPPTAPPLLGPRDHLVPVPAPTVLAHADGSRVREGHRARGVVRGADDFLAEGVEAVHVVGPVEIEGDAVAELEEGFAEGLLR